ncbi:hypothetical protein ACHAXA_011355 [Cyclostephanos tholiformis]|uniref:WW domain-containing protein n=1 Tax=Cyclostephanos tholiformis TaxID=382380 RepID=A0ABD3R386_9STRA
MDNTRRGKDDTDVWYAFHDPTSGREYYHRPGGETSWVLPTTRGIIDGTVSTTQRSTTMDDYKARNGEEGRSCSSKPTVSWSTTMGIAIVVILIFNTMFLLVLVNVIMNVNDGQNPAHSAEGVKIEALERVVPLSDQSKNVHAKEAIPTFDGSPLPSSAHLDPGKGSHRNESATITVAAAVGDSFIPAMASGVTPACIVGTEGIVGTEPSPNDVVNNKHTAHEEKVHQDERNESEIGEQNAREWDVPPKECWIPFSYVLIGKCRRHARKGLQMPLADAELLLLI